MVLSSKQRRKNPIRINLTGLEVQGQVELLQVHSQIELLLILRRLKLVKFIASRTSSDLGGPSTGLTPTELPPLGSQNFRNIEITYEQSTLGE